MDISLFSPNNFKENDKKKKQQKFFLGFIKTKIPCTLYVQGLII